MSDTKTRDPQVDAEEKQRLREIFEKDQEEARQAETPSYPPQEEETPQGPNTGDTPIRDSIPKDSSQGDRPSKPQQTSPKGNAKNNSGSHFQGTGGKSPSQGGAKPGGSSLNAGNFAGKASKTPGGNQSLGTKAPQVGNLAGKGVKNPKNNSSNSHSQNPTGPSNQEKAQNAANTAYKAVDTGQRVGRIAAGDETALEDYKDPRKLWQDIKYVFIAIFIALTIVLLVIVAVIAFLMTIFGGGNGTNSAVAQANQFLTVTKTSDPSEVQNGQQFKYTISVTAKEGAGDVTVIDPLPPEVRYVGSSGQATMQNDTVIWSSKINNLTAPFTTSFTITVAPIVNDTYVVNQTVGTVTATGPAPGTGPVSGYIPPAPANSCNGKYTSLVLQNYLLPKNYGDPVCDYSKNAQYKYLQQVDPTYADLWFYTITPGESSYNPNDWAPPVGQQATLDAAGAWGLYQMGSSSPPGSPPPAPGKNGQFDRGDVNWQIQTNNAINYNRTRLHCNFRYWATARAYWGRYSC